MFCLNLNCLPKKLTDRNIITTTCRVIGRESELSDLYNGSMNDLTPRVGTRGWRGDAGGEWLPPLSEGSWMFFLEDKASATDAFSSCSFNVRAHFETSLVMVSYYI